MLNEPLIIWEKWSNPLLKDTDIDEDPIDTEYPDFNDDHNNTLKNTKVIITPLGIVPFDELNDCDSIYNFWTGHTNFNISNTVASIIEEVSGVETLDIFTRYRFRIGVGKAFKDGEVIADINNTVYSKLKTLCINKKN